jgi:hypothetical protein
MNLPITRPALLSAIHRAWPTTESLVDWPRARVAALVHERFGQEDWNMEFD